MMFKLSPVIDIWLHYASAIVFEQIRELTQREGYQFHALWLLVAASLTK